MRDLSDLVADRDITPLTDSTINLGSANNKFSSLYLSGNTIVLGNTTIKSDDAGGGLTLSLTGSNTSTTLSSNTFKSLAAPILENNSAVPETYRISANKNAISFGPVKLNKSVSFTIGQSSKWKIFA